MPKNARCCVGGCDNDERYPKKFKIRSNASAMNFFKFTRNASKRPIWMANMSKGRTNLIPGGGTFVCANHFIDGRPTPENPNPTLFLTPTENKFGHTPTKKGRSERLSRGDVPGTSGEVYELQKQETDIEDESEIVTETEQAMTEETSKPDYVFEEVIKEGMVHFYTGLPNTETFKFLFDQLYPKAINMIYWKGERQLQKEKAKASKTLPLTSLFQTLEDAGLEPPPLKPCP